MTQAWVYILLCADGSYFAGHTTDLTKRIEQHQAGEGSEWTRRRRPVRLVFSQQMPSKDAAFVAERRIKGWTRAKKEALIAGDWDQLRWLSKKPRFRE